MIVAIFAGGDSSEYVISMKSAKQVQKWLEAAGHTCYPVEVKRGEWTVHVDADKVPLDKNSFGFKHKGRKVSFGYAWNTIHGTPGEDGKLQGFFDMMIRFLIVGLPFIIGGLIVVFVVVRIAIWMYRKG